MSVVENRATQDTFLGFMVNFFVISMYPFFTYFLTPKIANRALKKFSASPYFSLLSYLQYLNNYLGQPILNQYIILNQIILKNIFIIKN